MLSVSSVVGFAKELVRSRSVRSSECMTSTILVRDLEHLLASGCDGSTQALGNNTSSMSCAVKGTSEPAKPCACSDINSPLLKGKTWHHTVLWKAGFQLIALI